MEKFSKGILSGEKLSEEKFSEEKFSLNTEMKNAVKTSGKDAPYDEGAKRLLGIKYILAYILRNIVDEFRGMSPADVIPYIEGEPYISAVPVEPCHILCEPPVGSVVIKSAFCKRKTRLQKLKGECHGERSGKQKLVKLY